MHVCHKSSLQSLSINFSVQLQILQLHDAINLVDISLSLSKGYWHLGSFEIREMFLLYRFILDTGTCTGLGNFSLIHVSYEADLANWQLVRNRVWNCHLSVSLIANCFTRQEIPYKSFFFCSIWLLSDEGYVEYGLSWEWILDVSVPSFEVLTSYFYWITLSKVLALILKDIVESCSLTRRF